jgi:predicted dehydrogenase
LHEAQARGLKHGAVEDKIYLPGLTKLTQLAREDFFGRIVGFRLEFGWWVFDGIDPQAPGQRPSWNYRADQGGGLILDMYPHWRYVIEGILGPIARVSTGARTAIPNRVDERAEAYSADVDDMALTMVELENGALGTLLCSWATRVRRDDLLTLHVDGTEGSAVAGLHRCWIQRKGETLRTAHFSITNDLNIDYRSQWSEVPAAGPYTNPYRVGWEAFLRHVAVDAPMRADYAAGVRDVAFAEACFRSAAEGRWVKLEETRGG